MSILERNMPKIENKIEINSINEYNKSSKINLKEYNQIIDKNEDSLLSYKDSNKTSKDRNDILNSIKVHQNDFNNNKIKKNIDENEKINIDSFDNINMNINLNEKISLNHEIISSCINNCINWTLRAHINKNNNNKKDFKSNYIFKGKNIFFSKLDFSILNAFNNNLCFDRCFPKNKTHFENKKKIIEKLNQESIGQIKEIIGKRDLLQVPRENNEIENQTKL